MYRTMEIHIYSQPASYVRKSLRRFFIFDRPWNDFIRPWNGLNRFCKGFKRSRMKKRRRLLRT
jgi:hypothetical protein